MSVPHGVLLDYNYNAAHEDHIHVEPPNQMGGTPPTTNPGMSDGVRVIYDALTERFGRGEYFYQNGRYVGNDPGVGWTHMGGYNRRYISGTTTWSQHSWWNALDIGPYIREDQDVFIDFLKGNDANMGLTAKEIENVQKWSAQLDELGSNGGYVKYVIPDVRKNIVTVDELQAAIDAIETGTVDTYARNLARKANSALARIKATI